MIGSRRGTTVAYDDVYEEVTKKQSPSNRPFLVERHSTTCCTYRWKFDESTAIMNSTSVSCCLKSCRSRERLEWKSVIFGDRWTLEFADVGHSCYSLFLWSRDEYDDGAYVHVYAGLVNPVKHDVESIVPSKGIWMSSVPKINDQRSFGFCVFMSYEQVEQIIDLENMIILEIGIETLPYRRAHPNPLVVDIPRIASEKPILPMDIFHCAVCQDACVFHAVLCAQGQHTICAEHVTSDQVNLCGCCKTSLKNANPMPPLLSRLYKTISTSQQQPVNHVVVTTTAEEENLYSGESKKSK